VFRDLCAQVRSLFHHAPILHFEAAGCDVGNARHQEREHRRKILTSGVSQKSGIPCLIAGHASLGLIFQILQRSCRFGATMAEIISLCPPGESQVAWVLSTLAKSLVIVSPPTAKLAFDVATPKPPRQHSELPATLAPSHPSNFQACSMVCGLLLY
jgi:hypothetical protein